MTRETHHHCQCDYCDGEDCKDLPKATRSELTTQELVDELSKRKGVTRYLIDKDVRYHIEDETGMYSDGDKGEATILVIAL
jgi:hypothetical protein